MRALFVLSSDDSIVCVGAFSGDLSPSVHVKCVVLPRELVRHCGGASNKFSYAMPMLRRCTLTRFVGGKCFRRRLDQMQEGRGRGVRMWN